MTRELSTRFPSQAIERRAYRINDFCKTFGLGRTGVYKLIRAGKLPSVMVGGRRLIPADQAEALLRGDQK
jgi:excisionase family DNA binding protein